MIKEFNNKKPMIDKSCYISESVDIIGEVVIEKNVNIWFGTRIRGDMNKIYIGENSNIQENSVVHVDSHCETNIGKNVTIGHGAIIHGCIISENVLVGMGSIILNGAKIGKNTIIGAGSLVPQGKEYEEGVLILGSPAKVIRKLTEDEIKGIERSANNYVELSKKYL
ncbi:MULTISPECIES: gamma carbonic anhydrase family protein [Clostridium]|jgi:carbonic anhydrase/acetyltransferase-like protein (isoleucine patch superfamily)|uniref:Carbonic anhydrase n=1 Tax=Clostridium sartagoforme AAU1 TaxID=1202534 RepID=R9CAH1_9CLOT|nr:MULTISPECIES: gamma carbonic anhydrase family protein [Clostridium]EOR26278.1 carbonic anhydrase [Clostridium sartagoforme AAU1]KLE16656.1 transferase [Clostridium sp. C8]